MTCSLEVNEGALGLAWAWLCLPFGNVQGIGMGALGLFLGVEGFKGHGEGLSQLQAWAFTCPFLSHLSNLPLLSHPS